VIAGLVRLSRQESIIDFFRDSAGTQMHVM
jgi:hypothetical protein